MSTHVRVAIVLFCCGACCVATCDLRAEVLTPSTVYANAFHVTVLNGNDATLGDVQAGAFITATNGTIRHGSGSGQIDGFDTWEADDTGAVTDFVGLGYNSPATFDNVTVELGNQFVDGGDWESAPSVYILKNPVMNSESVRPERSPNWIEVPAVLISDPVHVFDPLVIQGPGGTVRFAVGGSVADRTGWGWAVGGVDGNERGDGIFNFISVTELYAEGTLAAAPAIPVPATPQPMNVVANTYHSVNHSGEDLVDWRGEIFEAITNGVIEYDGPDGFDTWDNDAAGVATDFVGLQYNSLVEFDTITIDLGHQFGDGGDWEETPKVYVLKNPVDTGQVRPEDDPINWVEVAAVETGGHEFDPLVIPGPGDTLTFSLNGSAGDRTGWGWAVGGVDGNQRDDGIYNFISITEVSATGMVVGTVPLPGDYNRNGELDGEDLDLQAAAIVGNLDPPAYDLNRDGDVSYADREMWVHDLKRTYIGDANLNGEFNSEDFVQVFAAGKYESGQAALWSEGDWSGDQVFDSSDFVAAFVDGGYELGPRQVAVSAVPEPGGLALFVLCILSATVWIRRHSV